MSLIPYINNGEPVDDVVSNRALRQVLVDSGLDPDANFPGFLAGVGIQEEGSLIGSAYVLNFTGPSITASMSGNTATIDVSIQIGPGTIGAIPKFDTTTSIADSGWGISTLDILPDTDITQSIGSLTKRVANISLKNLTFGTDPNLVEDVRFDPLLTFGGKSADGASRQIFSLATEDGNISNVNIGTLATTALPSEGAYTRLVLRRGAYIIFESVNGNLGDPNVDFITAAGNFDPRINISGWVFDSTNNAFKSRWNGSANSSLGTIESPWGRAYLGGVNLEFGNVAATGTIRGLTGSNWYNRNFTPANPDIPVIGTNAANEVVLNGYLRVPLSAPGSNTYLKYDGTDFVWASIAGGGTISGSGTIGYLPKFSSSTALTDSIISESGTEITINSGGLNATYISTGALPATTGAIRVEKNSALIMNRSGTDRTVFDFLESELRIADQGITKVSIIKGSTLYFEDFSGTPSTQGIVATSFGNLLVNGWIFGGGSNDGRITWGGSGGGNNTIGEDTNRISNFYGHYVNLDGNLVLGITKISASTTLNYSNRTVLVDASGGAVTVTLPQSYVEKGTEYFIKKVDSSANVVTVAAQGSQKIDGASTYALSSQYDILRVQSYITDDEWYII